MIIKLNSCVSIFIILCVFFVLFGSINSSQGNKKSSLLDPNTIKANSASYSAISGDKAIASVDASAQATTGHTAVGASAASAASDTVATQAQTAAVANAGANDQLVTSQSHQYTEIQKTTAQQGDIGIQGIATSNYQSGNTQTTDLNGAVTNKSQNQLTKEDDRLYTVGTNNQETIKDKTVQSTAFTTQTGSPIVMTQYIQKDITITFDTCKEKIVIEKLIKRDDRVIIVSAAKYLQPALVISNVNYIKQLISGNCNCKAVKDYIIEILAERHDHAGPHNHVTGNARVSEAHSDGPVP